MPTHASGSQEEEEVKEEVKEEEEMVPLIARPMENCRTSLM